MVFLRSYKCVSAWDTDTIGWGKKHSGRRGLSFLPLCSKLNASKEIYLIIFTWLTCYHWLYSYHTFIYVQAKLWRKRFTEAHRKGIICETVSEDNENSRMPSRAPFNLGDNKAYLRNSSLSLFLRIKNTSFWFDFCVSLMR